MKKTLCLILALTMIFSLAGCGKSEKTPDVKQSDVIEPYLDEEGNFVSSLSEFVVEPDKYFPKSTVETNSEDDGSRIMVYVEFCTQEEIDAYAEKAKGERFVKMSYSDTDGKMWDDAEGWYSFAVMTEESGDDDQPLNCLFIYLINSDFAYDLKHPKVEETPVPTVDPTPEPTPEPTQEPEIRWDVIREHVAYISAMGALYVNDQAWNAFDYFSSNHLGANETYDGVSEDYIKNADDKLSIALAKEYISLIKICKELGITSVEDLDALKQALYAVYFSYVCDWDNEDLNTDLNDAEKELLEKIYQNSEILDVLPEILSDY